MGKKAKPRLGVQAGLDRQQRIKKLLIMALFSDDDLMNRFVLKAETLSISFTTSALGLQSMSMFLWRAILSSESLKKSGR